MVWFYGKFPGIGRQMTDGINYGRLYEYRLRGIPQAARQDVWTEVATFIHQRMDRPQRVLDAGAGRCEFINALPAAERWAVDAQGCDAYHDPDVKPISGSILDVDLPLGYFDGVFVSNVLEHLPSQDEVGALLGKLFDAMEPGGRIAVLGPNFRHCMREYFDCADHTLALTHIAAAEHVYAAGFDVTSVTARFLPYSFRGVLPPSQLLTRTYLRMPFAWHLLGKQFLVLGTKPKAPAGPAD